MSNETTDLDTRGSARRKLVRGSFAVPALLTLHNGGAIAATSINSCLALQNRLPSTQYASRTDDVWLRYQLWGYVNASNGIVALPAGFWIRGSDLSVYAVNGNTVWLSGNAYQRFELLANTLGQISTVQPEGPPEFSWQRVGLWVSLRVDQNGNLTGAGSTGPGSAVADSCWNSFAAGARL